MKTMIYVARGRLGPRAGMTLAELMVAAGILAVITVFSAQVMGDVSRVWLGGKGRSDTFIAARALMTRMRIDLESSLPLSDLPGFAKDQGKTWLEFSTRVPGVMNSGSSSGGNSDRVRRLSFVRYKLGGLGSEDQGYLVRADQAFKWEDSPFGASPGEPPERRLCPNVIGFAHRFVQRDGDMETRFVPAPATNRTVAVSLSLAVADDRAFQTMKLTGKLAQVSESLSSLDPEKWEEALGGVDATMPPEARRGVRVFHQVVPLPTAGREE